MNIYIKQILHYKIINDSAKSDVFLDFIKNIPDIQNKYLFLDNASIHHSKILNHYIKLKHINMLFNVPYSPEFNPIEIMFSKLKKIVRDCNNNNNIKQLSLNITNAMSSITTNDFINFFNHSFDKLRKS